ncbi:hypothetical protein [Lactiplantibacillus songbeiensis]|uniref:Uncharacterized protein n=1 Tax=Lactiplantibacillus songbeiensis TaxID=2559920 RepID=A0ABW4C2I0_9LACO|nr:hypothetical protein [Lactiplantibacillus songbeiensis]
MSNQPAAVATLYFKLRNGDGYYQLRCECGPDHFVISQIRWPAFKNFFSLKYWRTHFEIDRAMLPLFVDDVMGIIQPWHDHYDLLDTSQPNHDQWEVIVSNSDWHTTQKRYDGKLVQATNYLHRSGVGAYPTDFQQLLDLIQHYEIIGKAN